MKYTAIILSILFLLLTTTACNNTDFPEPDPKPIKLELKAKNMVESNNDFGLEMFKLIHANEPANFNISPLSVSLALAMTYNGAQAETKAAMEEALRFSGYSREEINQIFFDLVKALLEADDKVTLEIAQSIWYRLGFNVLEEFKSVNREYYDAEVRELDFARSDALDIINGWIEDKTHGKIKDMIERIDPSHVMFLVNAIYFNGSWKTEFEKENTRKQEFNVSPDKSIEVEMMHKTDTVHYQSNDLFSAIELPYGRGNFNMLVLLPNEASQYEELISSLNAENWKKWMDAFEHKREVQIALPKFKAEYEIELNDVLSDMGMEIAFDTRADFSGINGTGDLFIDFVQHNTFIDVNEKGTEAAAATVVAIKEYVMQNTLFTANRPFVYAITEKETGAILFMGKMMEPEY
jgi:serpin B